MRSRLRATDGCGCSVPFVPIPELRSGRSFTPPEGAERRGRYVLVWHLVRGAACRVTGTRASPALHLRRFSSRAALPGNRTDELSLRPDPGAQPAPPFIRSTSSHLRQPRLATARAVIRDDPEPCVASTQKPGRHTLLRQRTASGGALSEQGGATIREEWGPSILVPSLQG